MSYGYGTGSTSIRFGGPLTAAVKGLLIANGVCFLLQQFAPVFFLTYFALTPHDALLGFRPWQFVSYMFLHGSLSHLLLNMLVLWMFGGEVESALGRREFTFYYFLCGVGAGLTQSLFAFHVPTLGASGATFGLLLAFAWLFPRRKILLWFVIPIAAWQLAVLLGVIEFLYLFGQPDGVAHAAHLGGLAFGYVYLKRAWRVGALVDELRWKLRRRRFKVMRRDDDDFRVH